MSTKEIIEAAARAAWDGDEVENPRRITFDELAPFQQKDYRTMSKHAVIAALRKAAEMPIGQKFTYGEAMNKFAFTELADQIEGER